MKDKKKTNHSTDRLTELNFENELLKLQIQAELGPSLISVDDAPPEIANLFMKNILKIERTSAKNEPIDSEEQIQINDLHLPEMTIHFNRLDFDDLDDGNLKENK